MLTVAFVVVAGVFLSRPLSATWHRIALKTLWHPLNVTGVRKYVSPSYLMWNLHGRPDRWNVMKKRDKHTESLILLGELERRTFVLERQRFDLKGIAQLNAVVRQAYATNRLQKHTGEYIPGGPELRTITVVAHHSDIAAWEELIGEFDDSASSAQPDAAREPPPAAAVRGVTDNMNLEPESEAPADGGGR